MSNKTQMLDKMMEVLGQLKTEFTNKMADTKNPEEYAAVVEKARKRSEELFETLVNEHPEYKGWFRHLSAQTIMFGSVTRTQLNAGVGLLERGTTPRMRFSTGLLEPADVSTLKELTRVACESFKTQMEALTISDLPENKTVTEMIREMDLSHFESIRNDFPEYQVWVNLAIHNTIVGRPIGEPSKVCDFPGPKILANRIHQRSVSFGPRDIEGKVSPLRPHLLHRPFNSVVDCEHHGYCWSMGGKCIVCIDNETPSSTQHTFDHTVSEVFFKVNNLQEVVKYKGSCDTIRLAGSGFNIEVGPRKSIKIYDVDANGEYQQDVFSFTVNANGGCQIQGSLTEALRYVDIYIEHHSESSFQRLAKHYNPISSVNCEHHGYCLAVDNQCVVCLEQPRMKTRAFTPTDTELQVAKVMLVSGNKDQVFKAAKMMGIIKPEVEESDKNFRMLDSLIHALNDLT